MGKIRIIMAGIFTFMLLGALGSDAQEQDMSPCFDFSLRVGQRVERKMSLKSLVWGDVREYTQILIVEAKENITIKAGIFNVFRVLFFQKNDIVGPLAWQGERARYWCSSELRMVIKMEIYAQGLGYPFRKWELKINPQK